MANVQHIFSGNGDPNVTPPTGATAGSHYDDLLSGTPYILSSTGAWHPIQKLARGTTIEYQPSDPVGTMFVSSVEAGDKVVGVRTLLGWEELTTIERAENVTASTPVKGVFMIDTMNSRLCVNIYGELKYINLIDFA